jgi:putative restriction endonuclease
MWLRRLRESKVYEANFWQPRPTPIRQDIGTPWLFKVRGRDQIAGYGILSYYTVMPRAVAWETFGNANGVESYSEMHRRVAALRHSSGETDDVGCVVLSDLLILEEDDYIAAPSDWAPNIVRGKYYDIDAGEGARAWTQLRIAARPPGTSALDSIPAGYGKPTVILPRRGQGAFRLMVMDAYDRRCAVSGEKTLPVLEAAHIRPFSETASHNVSNGVLLRSDIHKLFDLGYVTITPDNRFRVSSRIRDQFSNGVIYYDLHGRPVRIPDTPEDQPSRSALEWHSTTIYRE